MQSACIMLETSKGELMGVDIRDIIKSVKTEISGI